MAPSKNWPPRTTTRIFWTKHAIDRLHERFEDFEGVVPYRVIELAGRDAKPGKAFRVRRGDVIFVCKVDDGSVKILTVLRERDGPILPGESLPG